MGSAVKGQKFENISPIDGHVVCTIARSTAEDVELALDAAHAAREAWGRTSPAERAQTLLRIADRIEQKLDLLALVETIDNGKPFAKPRRPTAFGDRSFRYLLVACARKKEASARSTMIRSLIISMSRLGGAQIIPWNFPILMAVWKLAPALAAGIASF